MDTKDNGGPAFPVGSDNYASCGSTGMTLRDYFAAKAMKQMMVHVGDQLAWAHKEVASEAYAIADAMLEARKQ
jgi:hypothetical protein